MKSKVLCKGSPTIGERLSSRMPVIFVARRLLGHLPDRPDQPFPTPKRELSTHSPEPNRALAARGSNGSSVLLAMCWPVGELRGSRDQVNSLNAVASKRAAN